MKPLAINPSKMLLITLGGLLFIGLSCLSYFFYLNQIKGKKTLLEITQLQKEIKTIWPEIQNVDRSSGFGDRLDSVAQLLEQGNENLKKRRYEIAFHSYLEANGKIRVLKQLNLKRQQAINARDEALYTRQQAKEVELTSEWQFFWSQAEKLFSEAELAFEKADFSNATQGWLKAGNSFLEVNEKLIVAKQARENYQKLFGRFEKSWFEKYGDKIWKQILQTISEAEKKFNLGKYSEAKTAYLAAQEQLLNAAKEAQETQEAEQFLITRQAYYKEKKKYDTTKIARYAPKIWTAVCFAEASAEVASKKGFQGEASYHYTEANRLLQDASLSAEITILEQLQQIDEVEAKTTLVKEKQTRLQEKLKTIKEEIEKLKREEEKRHQKVEHFRNALIDDSIQEKYQDAGLAATARAFFMRNDFPNAIAAYEKILEKEACNPFALSDLGVAYFNRGEKEAAELALRAALAKNSFDPFALSVLGTILSQKNSTQEAVGVLRLAMAISPDNPEPHHYLGIYYMKKNDLNTSEKELRKAIELRPEFAEAHFNLAVVLASQTPPSLELARRHYKKALALGQPTDLEMEKRLFPQS